MDKTSHIFATAFTSERLVYRAVTNNAADKELVYKFTDYEPISAGLGNHALFRQKDPQSSGEMVDKMFTMKMLLNVFICLPVKEEDEDESTKSLGPGERAARRRDAAVPIGHMVLSPHREGQAHVRFTRIGLCLEEKHQNKGYGGEAVNWAVDWAFRFANVHKVEIGTAGYNERAAHLYERLGFKLEGRIREVVFMDRKWYDLLEFGMLEREWEELRGMK